MGNGDRGRDRQREGGIERGGRKREGVGRREGSGRESEREKGAGGRGGGEWVRERGRETEVRRQRGGRVKEREGRRAGGARENLNLKTLILIWSIRNYLTFSHRHREPGGRQ